MTAEVVAGTLAAAGVGPEDIEVIHVGNAFGQLFTGQGHLGAMPATVDVFESYMHAMVRSVEVTDAARQIASDLFAPLPDAPWLSPAMPLMRELTAGLLPRCLREAYGLSWGRHRARTLVAAERLSRAVLPHLPERLVAPPGLVMPPSWSTGRRFDSAHAPAEQ